MSAVGVLRACETCSLAFTAADGSVCPRCGEAWRDSDTAQAGTRAAEIEAAFLRFVALNPRVWDLFERYANLLVERGWRNYGAKAIVERVRWDHDLTIVPDDGEPFKIKNEFTPYFARHFHKLHPEHGGFFRVRELPSERRPPRGAPDG